MSNEKQTAVDWLTKKLWDEFGIAFSNNILEQAKVIEKQQIVEAFDNGLTIKMDGEQYYSQTYKQ